MLLFVGFYALALAIAAALAAFPVVEYYGSNRIHVKADVLFLFGAAVIVWSILPRFDRFTAPGPRLTREENPRLFAEIDRVAAATKQAPPAEVYLVHDVNAFVTERGGFAGIGRRRVMGLGLPLLHVLTVKQLRAVLAHEFGHYVGGDTALGPWVYRTRAAIGRTVENLGGTGQGLLQLVALPFEWYGRFFLVTTLAVSRAQEYAADRLAARLEGPGALATSLERIHGAALAMPGYFDGEYAPILGAGFRPPYAQGFSAFLEARPIASQIEQAVAEALASDKQDPLDTHPCLRDRLAALAGLPPAGEPDDGALASTLLGDPSAAELTLLRAILTGKADDLAPIGWEDVGSRVTLPRLKGTAASAGAMTGRFVDLAVGPEALAAIGARVAPTAPRDRHAGIGAFVVTAAVLVRLCEQGFALDAPPGLPFAACRDGVRFAPAPVLADIAANVRPREAWVESLREAGLGDASF